MVAGTMPARSNAMIRSRSQPKPVDLQDLAAIRGGRPSSQGGSMAIDAIAKLREQGLSAGEINKRIRMLNILNGAPVPK